MDLTYTFNDDAGKESLHVKGELYKYLVKVRRHCEGDELSFRSRTDMKNLHTYRVVHVEPKVLELSLISSEIKEIKSKNFLHVAWCIIDSNSIEKVLPSLCEIGVEKISFISCSRSQKNFKLDFKRFERIIEASMQQSGRSSYLEFDTYKNIKDFIDEFPKTKVFDFCDNTLNGGAEFETVLIGCEGGFSQDEKEFLSKQENFRLSTSMVLRSESAVMAVASKILL
ncbi:16S rRNA (uracil(1498)-N(3))-methyltransferase [Candidatus Sulfurimonas marisnigri]|uniref:16S rRNA (uracil(1498)-N(3))-methyltransferase n=1 Tax=Candidatus Sulfurimonas marisnigri TaxID=2740405 RepID=UPI001E4C629A|nr:16S rRNA (uracil(1498)-N(3))-methyltransferase [Candidatus Sulfurimonas marisnigri]